MKMRGKLVISFIASMVVGLVGASDALAAISGSAHDFSTETWNSSGEICIVCHTPHSAMSDIAPLWNHTVTTATFEPYTSSTLTATVGTPSASSKACLSCHDGTVAIDSFGGNTGSTTIGDDYNLGTDLRNDHPVSFTYDDTLATNDGGLEEPSTTTVGALDGKTIEVGMLIDGKLECSSCHDVHKNKGDSPGLDTLLLVNNSGSALCLTCHKK